MSDMQVLDQWRMQPAVLLFLALLVGFYLKGWPHYQRRPYTKPQLDNSIDTVRISRPWLFFISLFILALALLSPIYYLSSQFFFMRVAQHLLLISVFPAIFMRSNPFPVLFYGLPKSWQYQITERFAAQQPLYQRIKRLTSKGLMWFIFVGCVWLWYDETLHQWTLDYPAIRIIEVLTLITAALFHWWHITGASPRIHQKLPSITHVAYTLFGAAPLKIPGLFLLFSTTVLYHYPTTDFFGVTIEPLLSQRIGGAVIWVLGGMVYSTTALRFLSHWFGQEGAKPPQPRTIWDNDESMMAPGIGE